jgi:RHS repeat-associated protein
VYRYQGEALDAETGLYYLRARYYDPVAGRFLSVDPMADEGEHPYTYAGADPVNGADPTGQQEVLEASMVMAYFVPPAQVFIGMAANIKCIAGVTLSVLAQPSALLQNVVACQVRSADRGKSGGGGANGGSGTPCRSCSYMITASSNAGGYGLGRIATHTEIQINDGYDTNISYGGYPIAIKGSKLSELFGGSWLNKSAMKLPSNKPWLPFVIDTHSGSQFCDAVDAITKAYTSWKDGKTRYFAYPINSNTFTSWLLDKSGAPVSSSALFWLRNSAAGFNFKAPNQ